jgi:hypothetical protein
MIRGLFINPAKVECSIHESGKMFYEALKLSDKYILDYITIDENNRDIPDTYDFYIFNYHHYAMEWLDPESIKKLPGFKATFVLEMMPDNPFVLMPCNIFDAYCVVDPTMNIQHRKVFTFPRPLEVGGIGYGFPDRTTIGTFGFATKGKAFHKVVEAVNKEFDDALIRINMPLGAYAGSPQKEYQQQIADLCRKTAKKGIDLEITFYYLEKYNLVHWCSMNTLNCFLYDREQPGLSATTDQAITSGKPLAVGTSSAFRHIHKYCKPYPYRSLNESIVISPGEVRKMQEDWHPLNFAKRFEEVLALHNVETGGHKGEYIRLDKINPVHRINNAIEEKMRYTRGIQHVLQAIKPDASAGVMYWKKAFPIECEDVGDVLIVNHKEPNCGVHQYGVDTYEALKQSNRYVYRYCECSDRVELERAVSIVKPHVIIYNYYPAIFPWITPYITKVRLTEIPQLALMHEVTQGEANVADNHLFDYHILPDPTIVETNKYTFKIPRLIPTYTNRVKEPDVTTIGSFGFGFPDKGFDRIIRYVRREFDEAVIRFSMPPAGVADKSGKLRRATVKRCTDQMAGADGIKLEISDAFMNKVELFDFLAGNTANAFMYDSEKFRGIASSIECALAVPRPLIINKCRMFRHVFNADPSICIEDRSMKEIIASGTKPLEPFYESWSPKKFVRRYDDIIDEVL